MLARLRPALERHPRLAALLLGAASVPAFAELPMAALNAVPLASTLALLSLAGLFMLTEGATPKQAAARGFAWGGGCFLAGVSWVYVSLAEFSGMAAPLAALATLLFCLYLALFPALACAIAARWRSGGTTDAFLFASAWTISEWLRGTLFTGFPWLAIGYSQAPPSPLAGYAAVVGVYGVGLATALAAGVLIRLATAPRRHAAVALIALVGVGAVLRGMPWTQPAGEPLAISLLQGNVPQSMKWEPGRTGFSIERYMDLAQRYPADLVVLPETAIPLFFDAIPEQVLDALAPKGNLILGAAVRTTDGGYANGAVARLRGQPLQAYAKRHLVPFGEYAPPGFAWFFRFASIPMSSFTAGPAQQSPFAVGEQRIAANICYEDVFGEELLDALPAATLLLNLSNTAWFGDSLAQPQHLQIARLRALETGRPMLRATNTGMTALILPDGRVEAALPPFTTAALRVSVQGHTGLTPYARWGNALVLTLAVLACAAGYRRRKLPA